MKRSLIVSDFQVDFVTGALGFAGAPAIDAPIARKVQEYLDAGEDVYCLLDTHEPDYLSTREGKALPVPHCVRGSEGWQMYGRTGEVCRDLPKLEKQTFGCAALIPLLQRGGYDAVEVCGLVTNICVLSCCVVVQAALPQATVRVDAACVGSYDAVLHEKALDVLRGLQVQVI